MLMTDDLLVFLLAQGSMMRERIECNYLLTRGGLVKKGRDLLLSAAMEVAARPLLAGAKAEADPARRAKAAANFIIFLVRCIFAGQ